MIYTFIIFFTFLETERRIRANNREYNLQFNYAVSSKLLLLIVEIGDSCCLNLQNLCSIKLYKFKFLNFFENQAWIFTLLVCVYVQEKKRLQH